MAECLEDFIVSIQVFETVVLMHIDRAWIMERKISKDIRGSTGLSNCTGDRKINTKIRLTTLKGKGTQNIRNIYPNRRRKAFPNSLTEKWGTALKSCTKSNILCICYFPENLRMCRGCHLVSGHLPYMIQYCKF